MSMSAADDEAKNLKSLTVRHLLQKSYLALKETFLPNVYLSTKYLTQPETFIHLSPSVYRGVVDI